MRQESAGLVPAAPWQRRISAAGEERQAEWLVIVIGLFLVLIVGLQIFDVVGMGHLPWWFFWSVVGSVGFAGLVRRMRASTPAGATIGGMICLKMLMRMRFGLAWTETALPELVALFGMTYLATRFGRGRGGAVHERLGRRASQVVANLGIAGLIAGSVEIGFFVGGLAALAEAAADTVASEMGKALGGTTVSVTTLRRVPPGTDGGISLAGSVCGVAAAGVVAGLAVGLGAIGGLAGMLVFVAGCAGVVVDSLLGATIERVGWFGNDFVNFASTGFAAFVAVEGVRFLVGPQPYW